MKTKIYFLSAALVMAAFLIFTPAAFGQRGRYYGYRHHNYVVRSYPSRVFYYNQPYITLHFGNSYYRYQHGYFYRPYGTLFQLVIPPIGIRIGALPYGYRSIYIGPDLYYYYHGIYYRPHTSSGYEVVKPPLGAVLDELPPEAKVTVIDGKKYYEQDGTYYEESISSDSRLQYTVVGTDGVLNTGGNNVDNTPSGPAVGDRTDELPADSKAVVINGQKLYLAPSGHYYKEVIEGNKVQYEVVGK